MKLPLLEWKSLILSFQIFKGELALLQTENESSFSIIIECLMGLTQRKDPLILINGGSWFELDSHKQMSLRGQIRILHKTNPFINNLDLYENISLPLKHHNHLSDPEIQTLLKPFLSIFNASSFIKSRPYQANDTQLKIAQWIRLLIGAPKLLILQTPEIHTPDNLLPVLEEYLKKYLNSGGGVLFLNSGGRIVFESLISKRYNLKESDTLLKPEEH